MIRSCVNQTLPSRSKSSTGSRRLGLMKGSGRRWSISGNNLYKSPKLCRAMNHIGKGSVVEEHCVFVSPKAGQSPTVIGESAHIRSHTVIYPGNTIGKNFRTGHGVMIREENVIGNDVSIGTHS